VLEGRAFTTPTHLTLIAMPIIAKRTACLMGANRPAGDYLS
jgi:hypothetical protein